MSNLTDAQITAALAVCAGTDQKEYLASVQDPDHGYAAALRELRELRGHVARLKAALPPDTAEWEVSEADGIGEYCAEKLRAYAAECRAWAAEHPE